ncbi:M24 family metallopeptidase [Chloroflexota bacterium]
MERGESYKPETGRELLYSTQGVLHETFGTGQCWWQERINMDRMRRERRESAREQLKKHGLGAILCFRDCNLIYIGSTLRLSYLTEAESFGPTPIGMRYLLFGVNSEKPIHHEHGAIAEQQAFHAPWLEVRHAQAPLLEHIAGLEAADSVVPKFVEQIKGELKEMDALNEPVGIDIYSPRLEAILTNAGIKVAANGIEALNDAKEIKTEDEIECMRIACSIAEAALYAVRKAIAPGVRESDLVGLMNYTAFNCGGTSSGDGFVVASGPNSWPNIRTFTDRMIRPQDVVFVDAYGCRYQQYHTCYYRTFVCGKAWPEIKEAFKKVAHWQREPLDKGCKAGNTTADIAKWFPSADEWGAKDEAAISGNAICHGMGLTHFERPLISREWSLENPIPLKENQVFLIETQVGDGLGQGARLEDMVRITKTGYELLSRWPIDEIIECPY